MAFQILFLLVLVFSRVVCSFQHFLYLTLFSINDLLSSTTNSIHSFADDSTLHQSLCVLSHHSQANLAIDRTSVASQLNTDLNSILAWESDNLITLSQSKTQHLLISFRRDSNVLFLSLADNKIPQDASIDILGMDISSNLSWNSHIKTIATRASQKPGFLCFVLESTLHHPNFS